MFKQKLQIPVLRAIKPVLVILILVVLGVAPVANFFLQPQRATAATSSTINFQARLLTSAGSIVTDGNYHVEFKIYNALTSTGTPNQGACTMTPGTTTDTACLWTETRTTGNLVRVVNGYLTVSLGSVTAFPGTINWDQELWLSMRIGGAAGGASWETTEMTPRLKLTAVPYAFRAGTLIGVTGSHTTTLNTGTPSGNNTISLPAATGIVCLQSATACGFVAGTAANYIQNQTSLQSSSNFHISGAGVADTSLSTPLLTTASGDLTINPTGDTIIQGSVATNASAALNIQNSASASLLFARNDGNIGIGTVSPIAQLNLEKASYTTNQVVISNGVTGTPPSYPSSFTPTLTIQTDQTSGSRPLFFGYNNGGAWNAFLTVGACTSFARMCVDLGTGSTVRTALVNDSANDLHIGGGGDGDFTNVVFRNTGTVTMGAAAANSTAELVIQGSTSDSTGAAINAVNSGGSTSLLYVRNDGNVGIGTTNPKGLLQVGAGGLVDYTAGTDLNLADNLYYNSGWKYTTASGFGTLINQEKGAGGIHFYTAASSGGADAAATISEKLTILNGGNVGIGVANPGGKLSLTGSAGSSNTSYASLGGTQIRFQQTGGHEINAGVIDYGGFDTGSLSIVGLGTSSSNRNVRLFDTLSVGSGAPTTGVATFNGNVGIGTTNPGSRLTIQGAQGETSTTYEQLLQFNVSGGEFAHFYRDYNGSQNYLGLESHNVGNSAKNPIVLQEFGGNVGIGITNPGHRLDVQGGDVNTSGVYRVGGTQIASSNLSNDANLAKLNGTGPQTFTGNNKFTGTLLHQNASDSSTAFQIQNAAGSNLLTADTTNARIGIGTPSPTNTLSVSPVQYSTGTITTAGSSTTVTGSGTTWVGNVTVGSEIIFADGVKRTITAVNNNTSLTVSSAVDYASPTAYVIYNAGLQVTSTGKVGIGTTNPQTLLDVNGSASLGSSGVGDAVAGTLINLQGGTTANTAVRIGTNGAGGITIDSGTTGSILIGSGANAKTVTIGSTNTTSTLNLQGGTAGNINIGSVGASTLSSTVHIADTNNATGTQLVTIGSIQNASNTVTLRAGATTTTIANSGVSVTGGSISQSQTVAGVDASGISSSLTESAAGAATGAAFNAQAYFTGTSGTLTGLVGITGVLNAVGNGGTVSYGQAMNLGAVLNTGATVTNLSLGKFTTPNISGTGVASGAVGLEIQNMRNTASGTSTTGGYTAYGIQLTLPDQGGNTSGTNNNRGIFITGNGGTAGAGGVVNNYALYSDSTAQSYIAGRLGIGHSSPQVPLDVNGSTNLGSQGSGNAAAGTLINIQGGTTANTAVVIGTNGAGGITMDTGTTGAINIGTGANAKTILVGSTNTTSTLSLQGGVSGAINIGSVGSSTLSSTTHIADTNNATGTQLVTNGSALNANNAVTLEAGNTGQIQIGNGATAHTVAISTSNSAAQAITIGGTGATGGSHASTTVAIQGGATALSLANAGATLRTFTNSTTAFQIQNAAGTSNLFVADTAATRVGIGTASPSGRLNVAEATGTVHGPDQGTVIIDHDDNGGASSLVFRSKVNRGSDYGYIQYQDDTTIGGAGESARLIIGTSNDPDDHIILQPTGNVGIGIIGSPTPVYKLDVQGDIRSSNAIYANANNAKYFQGGDDAALWDINVGNTVGVYGVQDATIGGVKLGSGGGTISGFNNNIGIGTTSPGYKLDVQGGDINTSALYRIGGTQIAAATGTSVITLGNTGLSGGLGLNLVAPTYTTSTRGVVIGTSDGNITLLDLDVSTQTSAETAGNCSTTINPGGIYYSSATTTNNTTTQGIRGCINGTWEDIISSDQHGIMLLGVVEDSGSDPGDVGGITAVDNGPCKVSRASSTSVSVEPCIAYSGGRKVVVSAAQTVSTLNGNTLFYHICLNGTNGSPVATTGNASQTAAVPTFSATAPVLCLATVKTGAGSTITNIYDTRTFVSSRKQFVTFTDGTQTGVAPGMIVTMDGANANRVGVTNLAADPNVRGVVAVGSTSNSTTTVNAILTTGGPAFVVGTGTITVGQTAQTSTTLGYAGSAAAVAGYKDLGLIIWPGATAACNASTNCQYSMLVDVQPH